MGWRGRIVGSFDKEKILLTYDSLSAGNSSRTKSKINIERDSVYLYAILLSIRSMKKKGNGKEEKRIKKVQMTLAFVIACRHPVRARKLFLETGPKVWGW